MLENRAMLGSITRKSVPFNSNYIKTCLLLTKTKLREQIEEFPEKFSVDELVERLILIEKIDHGIEQSEKDEVISDAEMTNEMKTWFESQDR